MVQPAVGQLPSLPFAARGRLAERLVEVKILEAIVQLLEGETTRVGPPTIIRAGNRCLRHSQRSAPEVVPLGRYQAAWRSMMETPQ